MIRWCIRLMSLANGQPHSHCPGYVKRYDPDYVNPDGYDGGVLEVTPDTLEAQTFATASQAWEFWKQTAPAPYHIRADGQPNRPLTAFHATIERVVGVSRE